MSFSLLDYTRSICWHNNFTRDRLKNTEKWQNGLKTIMISIFIQQKLLRNQKSVCSHGKTW